MTLMELLGMERLQLQASRELEALRQETRAAQVRRQRAFDLAEFDKHSSLRTQGSRE